MARTFRRKSDTHLLDPYRRNTVVTRSKHGGLYCREVEESPGSPDFLWGWLYVHTDGHSMTWHAPSSYKRIMNKSFRQDAKRRMQLPLNHGDMDVVLPRFYRNADWYYF